MSTATAVGISPHECRLMSYMKLCRQWRTAKQIAEGASVAIRTVNGHTKRLSVVGVLERMETHPAPMFRFTTASAQSDPAYVARIADACEALGVAF